LELEQFNKIDINLDSIVWKLSKMIRQIEVDTDKIEIGTDEWKHKLRFWRESTCAAPQDCRNAIISVFSRDLTASWLTILEIFIYTSVI
jgi:hypothetical protein